jgi:hypothetical protein
MCVSLSCNRTGKLPLPVSQESAYASIVPDLHNTTIPPNIAPLNFKISAKARKYKVVLSSRFYSPLIIESAVSSIIFPLNKWRRTLAKNAGNDLILSISIPGEEYGCRNFAPCTIHVARESIDPVIAYRIIKPIYNWWADVGIYARDLRTFKQREIISGGRFENGCVNCHSFLNNDPRHFILSVRSKKFDNASIFISNEKALREASKFGYSSWHPGGKFITFSTMQVNQFFHTARIEIRDVVDMYSYLACYDIGKHAITKIDNLFNPHELQTYPAWAPDGKTMFYCAAKALWDNRDTIPPRNYTRVRYSLLKIPYDVSSKSWGKPESVLSSDSTGKSLVMPRVSPDGKHLVFCMCDYGVFPAFQKSSDLYCMDITSGRYWKLDCNSDESESWHAWSSNSRWMAFSSKRSDGVFTRIYICYFDESGKTGKPFVLPQQDPAFYESFMKTYSVPEFLTGWPSAGPDEINRAIHTMNPVDGKTSASMQTDASRAGLHQ